MIKKKKFVVIAFNLEDEIFVVYVTSFSWDLDIYLSRKALSAFFSIDKVFIVVSSKYADFIDVFSLGLIFKLFKYIEIINYVINLVND